MKVKTIGIVAAMREEYEHLLKRHHPFQKEVEDSFSLYRFQVSGHSVCLIESGIGSDRASEAVRLLHRHAQPDVILNIGFGGAPFPGLQAGDLVLAERLQCFRKGKVSDQPIPGTVSPSHVLASAGTSLSQCGLRIFGGSFLTTSEILGKAELRDGLASPPPHLLVEMETSGVARGMAGMGVPLIAVRSVTDDAREELLFSIADFTDSEMKVQPLKVLLALLKRPRIIPQLMRLERNSRLAAKNLAMAVPILMTHLQD